ncbi:unnamed protein product, partial [Iphiclides podalirius]
MDMLKYKSKLQPVFTEPQRSPNKGTSPTIRASYERDIKQGAAYTSCLTWDDLRGKSDPSDCGAEAATRRTTDTQRTTHKARDQSTTHEIRARGASITRSEHKAQESTNTVLLWPPRERTGQHANTLRADWPADAGAAAAPRRHRQWWDASIAAHPDCASGLRNPRVPYTRAFPTVWQRHAMR